MFGARGATVLLLTVAMAAFTPGCGDDKTGDGGSGGTGGGGGSGGTGGGGSGGDGGMGGEGGAAGIRDNFETSLHNTRVGKDFWYSTENNGFESLTNVPYDSLNCQGCHNKNDDSWAGVPTCADCHDAESDPPKHLQSETCLGCHGRQNAEAGRLQDADYHKAMYACADCHKSNDVHGNGTEYDTMLRPGAIAVRCTDCHGEGVDDAPDPPSDSFHGGQHNAVDCALCHTETVISCINCHLEEDLDNGEKCASAQIFNWKFVMKWDKEGDGNEVYTPGTFMSLKYNCDRPQTDPAFPACSNPGDGKKTVALFAPYYAHTVTEQALDNILAFPAGPAPYNQAGCTYCHGDPADPSDNCTDIRAADSDNRLKLIEFEGTGGVGGADTGRLTNPISGLIPLPPDYKDKFAVDYVEFLAGAGTHCPTMENPKPLVLFETGPDLWQTGDDTTAPNKREIGAPLSQAEFDKFCPPAP